MGTIEIYGREGCAWCENAKRLATLHGVSFVYRDFTNDPDVRAELEARHPGFRTVPQIFAASKLIGGYSDLARAIADGYFKEKT